LTASYFHLNDEAIGTASRPAKQDGFQSEDFHVSKYFMATGVIAGLLGMGLGIQMGAAHDFTLAPAHAHLNLVGFVTMFLAGLFYDARPAAVGRLATIHYIAATLGAAVLVTGIAGSVTGREWGVPVAVVGSFITIFGMLLFVVQVLRFGTKRQTETVRPSWPAGAVPSAER
jgi:hypothetical protein